MTVIYVSRFGWRRSLTCALEVKTGQHLVWISHVKGHRPYFHGLKSGFFCLWHKTFRQTTLNDMQKQEICVGNMEIVLKHWWQPRCLYQLVRCCSLLISPYRSYVFFFNKTSVPHKSSHQLVSIYLFSCWLFSLHFVTFDFNKWKEDFRVSQTEKHSTWEIKFRVLKTHNTWKVVECY